MTLQEPPKLHGHPETSGGDSSGTSQSHRPLSAVDTPRSHRAPQGAPAALLPALGLKDHTMSWQPANILLDEFGHVRISDLGLACDRSKSVV